MLPVGVAVTVAPVVALRPVAGAQLYVFELPVAVNVTGAQSPLGPTAIVGNGFTVRLAGLEVAFPQGDVITTWKLAPFKAAVGPVSVKVFVVAPENGGVFVTFTNPLP